MGDFRALKILDFGMKLAQLQAWEKLQLDSLSPTFQGLGVTSYFSSSCTYDLSPGQAISSYFLV